MGHGSPTAKAEQDVPKDGNLEENWCLHAAAARIERQPAWQGLLELRPAAHGAVEGKAARD
eukprot:2650962-Prymnesium_polylepis.3